MPLTLLPVLPALPRNACRCHCCSACCATTDNRDQTSFNHIHHIGEGYLSDMGCVYTLGHQPGSVVKNNFCTDVQSFNYGGWAYYTDEGSRDELFENNIGARTKCAGHHQHYGTDNTLRNNVHRIM